MSECTACGSSRTDKDPFYYDWRGSRYWIRRCGSCTHQFVHPQISSEDQAQMYDDSYFAAGGDWVCGLFEGASYQEATPELIREAAEILRLIPIQSGRLLDIGCAGGVFLNEARAAGFVVQGVEINAGQAEEARNTYGVEVIDVRIEEAPVDMGPFDVVTILDVLEHIPRPLSVLQRVSRWQPEGGHLLIRGPLFNSRVALLKESLRRIIGPDKRLPDYPLDANMFNLKSMKVMLAAASYGVTNIWATHSFANVLAVKSRVVYKSA